MKNKQKKDEKIKEKDVKTKNNKALIEKNVKKDKKKGNIFKSIGKYFKGVGLEIKRIRWTSGRELVKYSVASIVFVVFFGLYFYAIDWIALLVRSLVK